MSGSSPRPPGEIEAALAALDKRRVVLAIHDASFPSAEGQDSGRGSPYSEGARELLAFARTLGFNGVQLGPQGQTSCDNPSPYDATLFSRNELNADLHALCSGPDPLLDHAHVAEIVAGCPAGTATRADHRYAYDSRRRALTLAYRAFRSGASRTLSTELAAFRATHADWLERDALYEVLSSGYGGRHFTHWPTSGEARLDRDLFDPSPGARDECADRRRALLERHADQIERYAFGQLVVHRQHAQFRSLVQGWGLTLYGDMQVGMAAPDEWSRRALMMAHYRLGAPPSRTNPEGQPWNYPILDPQHYASDSGQGTARDLFAVRLEKLFGEYDGLRIDHPHGLVCPWVYQADGPDPLRAVQGGARLFAAPDLPDHPDLAGYSIARPDQLDRSVPRYGEGWVRDLDQAQVERFATWVDLVLATARARGRAAEDCLFEVLSTCPTPLRLVMQTRGLGRFRVTQKANPSDAADVYRSDNAQPADWLMVGNHDTPPIWQLTRRWCGTPQAERHAAYLAARICPDTDTTALARELAANPYKLVQAMVADLFCSPARQVSVFFSDLLGLEASYNVPGTVHPDNWSLRVPSDYRTRFASDAAAGRAINLPFVLALALTSRGAKAAAVHRPLIARLTQMAAGMRFETLPQQA